MLQALTEKVNLEYLAIFLVGLLLLGQLQGLSLEAHISETYASFYINLAFMGIISVLGMVAFGIYYLSNDEIWKLSTKQKIAIHAGFVLFIVFMTTSGNQIIGVPKASIESFQMTRETELWTSSVIPGFFEDLYYLAGLPMTFAFILLIAADRLYGVGTREFMAICIFSCLVASIGYNIWVIPGFTTAHIPAYGQIQTGYAGAFIFSFGQSMIYTTTGWFVPAAHMLHNFFVVWGSMYMVV